MDQSNQHLRPPHPRRPPAHRSVSLLHSPRPSPPSRRSIIQPKDNKNPGSREASSQSGSSPDHGKPSVYSNDSSENSGADSNSRPLVSKDSSGESSNADKWFDKSNNDVSNTSLVDNDPPFFLQNSSSEDKSPMEGQQPGAGRFSSRTNMPDQYLSLGAGENSSDDFRGVIDDLTIENNKLKRKLRKYETLQDAHLDDEKLFEIRVHDLPASKKQELEELLRQFAAGLQVQPSQGGSSTTTFNKDRLMPRLQTYQTTSSKASGLPDSAYVSASGPASSAPSGSASGQLIKPFQPSALSRRNNIQNYLHDIPQGLLPQHSTAMTEKTKKRLVVRRLEQIFSGSDAALIGRHQPLQQQEVSRLAAKADRSDREASGRRALAEGNREARIMDDDHDGSIPMKTTPSDETHLKESTAEEATPKESKSANSKHSLQQLPEQGISEHDFYEKSPSGHLLQQRPTRPLDLDPQRAQIPADNIEYIRHLGFSPPDAYSSRSPEEGHGWIYLNLLMNMAQLHTMNVTTEFVKKALQDYSTRFELSSDGRKVRWRRNRTYDLANSEMDGTSSSSPNDPQSGQSPRKRIKLGIDNKFAYTPMFAKRASTETDDSSAEASLVQSPRMQGNATALPNFRNRSGSRVLKNHRKRENGPIIFYNNAKFCTDLSGDNKTEAAMIYNPIMYHVATSRPVGCHEAPISERTAEKKGPLNDAYNLPEPMDLADNPIPASMEINFPPTTPLTSGSERSPFEMEVSGLGGVYPADNFAINVRTKHAQNGQLAHRTPRHQLPQRCPNRLVDIILKDGGSRKSRSAFRKDFTSSRQKDLPPSELPPASRFISLDDSESEDEFYEESSLSFPPGALEVPATSAAPQPMEASWSSDDESDDEMSSENDGNQDETASDGSLDFLAGAREADPEFIRAREREYDSIMAERLAEEIPTGSSAATAGGGSGVITPVSVHQVEDVDAVLHTAPSVAASSNDSMIVNEDEVS